MLKCPGPGITVFLVLGHGNWLTYGNVAQLVGIWACDLSLVNKSLPWDLGWRYQERNKSTFPGELSCYHMGLELFVTFFSLLGKRLMLIPS